MERVDPMIHIIHRPSFLAKLEKYYEQFRSDSGTGGSIFEAYSPQKPGALFYTNTCFCPTD